MKRFYTFGKPHHIVPEVLTLWSSCALTAAQHREGACSVKKLFLFSTYEDALAASEVLFNKPRRPKTTGRVAPILVVEVNEDALPDLKTVTAYEITTNFLPPNYTQGLQERKFECYVCDPKKLNFVRAEYPKRIVTLNAHLKTVELNPQEEAGCNIL